jgi:hypothetical protein
VVFCLCRLVGSLLWQRRPSPHASSVGSRDTCYLEFCIGFLCCVPLKMAIDSPNVPFRLSSSLLVAARGEPRSNLCVPLHPHSVVVVDWSAGYSLELSDAVHYIRAWGLASPVCPNKSFRRLVANDCGPRFEPSGKCGDRFVEECYLVDPASSHMLVSKIKPCMCKYEQIQTVKLRMAH